MFDVTAEARDFAASNAIDWQKLTGASVLVTGATGLIGSACVRVLAERNRVAGADISVVCLVRNAARASEFLAPYGSQDGVTFLEGDVESFAFPSEPLDYIIHTACPTASRFFVEHPVETANAVVFGTRHVLECARVRGVRGMVYASSMEAYGTGNAAPGLDRLLTEQDVGYVNPLSPRSCYSEGKRMAEQYCASYAHEYGVPAMVVRLAQTFGPGIPKNDTRLFALCARNAMAGSDIVLKTTGASSRMYLYTMDAVAALITVMLEGEPGCAYNAANPATYSSVKEMAEMVATLDATGNTQVRCEIDPSAPFPPDHHLPLDVSRLMALDWKPTQDLPGMYRNLMAYLEG